MSKKLTSSSYSPYNKDVWWPSGYDFIANWVINPIKEGFWLI